MCVSVYQTTDQTALTQFKAVFSMMFQNVTKTINQSQFELKFGANDTTNLMPNIERFSTCAANWSDRVFIYSEALF